MLTIVNGKRSTFPKSPCSRSLSESCPCIVAGEALPEEVSRTASLQLRGVWSHPVCYLLLLLLLGLVDGNEQDGAFIEHYACENKEVELPLLH